MTLTSKKNHRIQLYRALTRERSVREKNKLFALEGAKLLEEALFCGYVPFFIAVTEKAASKYRSILEKIPQETEILTISEDLSLYIADTKSPQGIFFTLPLLDKILKTDKICNREIPKKKVRFVMLDGLQELGNAGAIIRSADAFGMDGIIISPDSCDIHSPKLARGAMGSVFRLPVYRLGLETAIDELKKNKFSVYAALPDKNAENLKNVQFNEKSCIIIGNEGTGITRRISELACEKIYIPIKNAESLNAAAAASIIMYEMTRKD